MSSVFRRWRRVSLRSNLAYRRARADQTQLESFMTELQRQFSARGLDCPYEAFYFRGALVSSAIGSALTPPVSPYW